MFGGDVMKDGPAVKQTSPRGGGAYPTSPTAKSMRETGIVSKLMQSYGFINCCERTESVFFHFSQCTADSSTLQEGDEVEFEVGMDHRTSKLIARRLVALPPGTVSFESMGHERLLGKVDSEPCLVRQFSRGPRTPRGGANRDSDPGLGRIIYEQQGVCYFIPYGFTDVNDDRDIHKGDEVSFYVATNKRTGVLRARLVRLVQAAKLEKVEGVVKALKESFGFIERADMVQDIFFHYSELNSDYQSRLNIGTPVGFVVQNRQGKEVATQMEILPAGSVVFDSVGDEQYEGVVRKPMIRSFTHGRGKEVESDPGEIIYHDDLGGTTVLPYTERDQSGNHTMLSGDMVLFNIASDRRSGSKQPKRATNVKLHKMVEMNQGNYSREKGIIVALRDGFGFIRCAERDARLFFHFNEVIFDKAEQQLQQNTEVEFSVQKDYTNERLHAVRIKLLPDRSVQFEKVPADVYRGSVQEELTIDGGRNRPNILKLQKDSPHGVIQYTTEEGEGQMGVINFYWCPEHLQFADQVEFKIAERSFDGLQYAVQIKVLSRSNETRFKGYVSVLKEGFGFIEVEEHDCELFFPFSSCNKYCDPRDLKLMDEVEYCLIRKNGRLSADEIKKLDKGKIPAESIQPSIHRGVILRQMKSSDNADEYEGLIRPSSPITGVDEVLPYSFTGLLNHQLQLHNGETVQFQVGVSLATGVIRAMNIISERSLLRGTIDNIKDQYGFISYRGDGGMFQTMFFHMNNLADGCSFDDLHVGDEVEFMTGVNPKTKKESAIYVKKLRDTVRPERLLNRVGSIKSSLLPMIIARQPRAPDGTRGFLQSPLSDPAHSQ